MKLDDGWLVPEPSVVWALACLLTLALAVRGAKLSGLDAVTMYWAGVWGVLGGLWGGHLYVVLGGTPRILVEDPWTLVRFMAGEKGVLGAMIGTCLLSWAYLKWRRASFVEYAGVAVPGACLGYALGRIGCFLNGDDFGTVTSVPWAVQFPPGTEAFAAHVARGWVTVQDSLSLPVHPTQLYHAGAGLLLFFVLRRWKGVWPGQRLAVAFIGYGALRFVIEWFRGDAAAVLGPLHVSHLFSLLFMAAGASLWWWKGTHRELRSPDHAILPQAEEALARIDHDVRHPSPM